MDIHNASYSLTPEDVLAFTKPPRRVVFQPGEQLFRFASPATSTFGGSETFGSPWWVPATTYQSIIKTANRTHSQPADVARSRLAVAGPWNPTMEWLMIIELKKPFYAWLGAARPQPQDGRNRSVLLLGQYEQAFVPGLAPRGSTSSDAAVLLYYGSPQT